MDSELIKYEILQKSIDKLSNSDELNFFNDSITIMTNNIQKIESLRNEIIITKKRKNDQIRTATDIRSFISKNIFQNLIVPLGIIPPEI